MNVFFHLGLALVVLIAFYLIARLASWLVALAVRGVCKLFGKPLNAAVLEKWLFRVVFGLALIYYAVSTVSYFRFVCGPR